MHASSRSVRLALLLTGLAITVAACGGDAGCPDPRTCGDSVTRVESLPLLEAAATPTWDEPPMGTASPQRDPELVEIHLDISSPMAGYLPPSSREGDLSTFQFIARNVAQHMARVYGSADAPVRWVGVGHELRSLGSRPRIERGVFDGRSTELDLSMERILGDFRSGRAEAAAIVSDLMATGDVTGPLTLFGTLVEWLRSEDVRSGAFHVGLFGVKTEYWGVTLRGCPARGPLGCWFDELRQRWIPLDTVARMPFYVLVIGRGADRVTSVIESLQATIDELNRNNDPDPRIETRWELLTRSSLGVGVALTCRAGTRDDDEPRPQYALFVDQQLQYCCVRDDTVTVFCDIEGGFQPAAARAMWTITPAVAPVTGEGEAAANEAAGAETPVPVPPAAEARIDGNRLAFDFGCSALRCAQPAGAGMELRIEATGPVQDAQTGDWRDWSTEVGEMGRTLQLQGFVEAVRISPDHYRLETRAILRFPGS